MIIPSFSKGEVLSASKLNDLARAVKEIDAKATSAMITDVEGGEFSRSAFGTVLTIPQITPGGEGEDASWSDAEAAHPFQVKLSVDESGNVSLRMKGGRWHGNGCGNYLGISYLETPAEALTAPPEKVEAGEDLFFIPDCGTQGGIGDGETFAVCLYAEGVSAGRIVSYPWAYLKKISSLKEFREELLEYAYSAVAIVGVWKLEAKDGVKYLKGAPGQMLYGDFYYKNNQIFSSGNFAWSRVEGISYGFSVSPGLIHVNPNNFTWGRGESKIGKIAPKDGATTGLSVKIPKLSLKTEVNSELSVLTGISENETTDNTVEKTVSVDIPYYKITRATGNISAGYTLSGSSETATATATSEYVQSISTVKETIHATPNDAEAWTKTVVTGVAATKSNPSISYTKNKYSLESSGTQTVVTDVSVTESGTKTVQATVRIGETKYSGSEETLPSSLKSAELSEGGQVEYPVEGDLRGGLFEVKEGDEADAAKLGISENEDSEFEAFSDFWVSVPGVSFKLDKADVAAGTIIALRLNVEKGEPSTQWELIRDEKLTASVSSATGAESEVESESAKTTLTAGCTHQLVKLTIEQRFETETETTDGITRTGAVFGVKAELDAATAGSYEAMFPVGMIFFDAATGAPTVQALCPGVIEYTPPLAIVLNNKEISEHTCEFEAPPELSDEPKTYADKKLAAQAAFTASAHGLETADLNGVWEILEG